jgi:hypothetical protein
MGCSNHPSSTDFGQILATAFSSLFNWNPIKSDNRYQEKYWQRSDGGFGRMTRSDGHVSDSGKSDYPHYTEIYDKNGQKQNFTRKGGEVTMWDSHYSTSPTDHKGAHKTAQATLDDLDQAIKDLRSAR